MNGWIDGLVDRSMDGCSCGPSAICGLLSVIGHLLSVLGHLRATTYYLFSTICYLLSVVYYLLSVIWQLLGLIDPSIHLSFRLPIDPPMYHL